MSLGFSTQSQAESPIVAVVGSAISQDGRSSSLTAPNGPSQQQASPSRFPTALHSRIENSQSSLGHTSTVELGAFKCLVSMIISSMMFTNVFAVCLLVT